MAAYLRRTAELVFLAFVGGAAPALLQSPQLDRAALHGAVAAGVAAVYAALAKAVGEKDRPTVL